jgi:hypothetical protein
LNVASLARLSSLQALTQLHFKDLWRASSLSEPLGGLPALLDVCVEHCPCIGDLAPLGGLKHLQQLRLMCCPQITTTATAGLLPALQRLTEHLTYSMRRAPRIAGQTLRHPVILRATQADSATTIQHAGVC